MLIVLAAMAGGMGWGIRGQYGHQTGAMLAGLLVGLVLVLFLVPAWSAISGARVVACLTLGISLGGSMTYGQTVGLTHDAALIGNWDALRWGLLGLFIKGGTWIGLAGLFLGLALSDTRYRASELALLLMAAVFIRILGIQLLNEPYRPDEQLLPTLYFSDHWFWEPDTELKPRREVWGGLLLSLVALAAYARLIRRDRLALRLAAWGFLAGGVGFATGQSTQAFHAWNRELFQAAWIANVDPLINWWNMMEITFGSLAGAGLAAGVWLNRKLIAAKDNSLQPTLTKMQESLLVMLHVAVLITWSFGSCAELDSLAGMAFPMILIPLVATTAGRVWPFVFVLPVILIPIAGKTLRQLSIQSDIIPIGLGWGVLVILPLALAVAMAVFLIKAADRLNARIFARWTLLFVTWLYFMLNFAFFEFPWPWNDWTGRTPSAMIFFVCAIGLTLAALMPSAMMNTADDDAKTQENQADAT